MKQMQNQDDLLLLGRGKDHTVYLSEPERVSHMHIVGGINQGKSKFLEYLIRHDVDRLYKEWKNHINPRDGRACGLCFIDGSEDGATMRQILSYCAAIRYPKVLVTDVTQSAVAV